MIVNFKKNEFLIKKAVLSKPSDLSKKKLILEYVYLKKDQMLVCFSAKAGVARMKSDMLAIWFRISCEIETLVLEYLWKVVIATR